MKKSLLLLFGLFLVTACQKQYETNPDPNHTHADFAVWVNGEQVDFSDARFMSGLSHDDSTHDEESEYHHKHLHLHDEVGQVLHRHKPELTLEEFFNSIDYEFAKRDWRMFINNPSVGGELWLETEFNLDYVFKDMDMILITNSQDDAAVAEQKESMTTDACMYSKTCPWRGEPPAENCVADPEVPCVVPEEDL